MLSPFRRCQILVGEGSAGRYALIGMTGFLLDFSVFATLLNLGMLPLLANAISSGLAIANNYALNAKFNFGSPLGAWPALRFFTVGTLGVIAATLILQLLVRQGQSPIFSKVLVLPIVVAVQFLASRLWVFKNDKERTK